MRLSTSARITLANSALLALSFSALLLLMTWLTDRFMVGHVEESVTAELHIMQAELEVDGLRGITALINRRMDNLTLSHDRLYRLESAQGTLLAGNVDTWPQIRAAEEETFRQPSRRYPGETEVVLQWLRLADGSRLLVGFDEIEVEAVRADIRRAALWGLAAMLAVSLGAGFILTRAALRPVEAIRASAQRIMEGDLRHRIPARPDGDEFDRLGETLNAMLDRINTLIASVRGATDNIAHDLRSPLTRHRSRLEAALQHPPTAEELRPWVERNLSDLDQVLATFQSLLRIASVESGLLRQEFAPCDVSRLIQDATEYIEPLAEEKGLQLEVSTTAHAPLLGHRHLLFQMLINLLDNAVKHAPEGSRIQLTAYADGTGWNFVIADSGPGIPVEERKRVFERLYRLDHSRQTPGLGLGLSLVKAIADLHQASIVLEDNRPGVRLEVSSAKPAA